MHVLTRACIGSVLLTMATRVSCGHGGRTLATDGFAWGLFWGLQAAMALGWSRRHGRWFGRSRADGRRG